MEDVTRPHRRTRSLGIVVGVVVLVALAGVGWVRWTNHQVWSRLDHAADDFGVPDGFTELQRVRSGDAFCFVSCTNGGEAVLTIVFDPGSLSEDEACQRVEEAVQDAVADAGSEVEPPFGWYRCDFVGPLEGTMRVGGFVERADELRAGGGERWLEEEAVPDVPLVAWVGFLSGIE